MAMNYSRLFEKLKEAGITTYKIRKDRIIMEGTLQKLRKGENVTTDTIGIFCNLLNCQPGDIMEYTPDGKE